ncbi:hypothetical protein AGDE_13936 [Angomonas deanei]|uniref:Uncharacterized protein n=1 Tax=Angomonas deanei TaxID=59799 RepID=A0A7G2CJK5_9TRYP|nr:hypothetical protein AGDE_13936 [Angomonas deanei]CAD2220048.1 hypothetical protein, conserved [Angomonas deanei]|eukprot:EPY21591.1 hypothetical protein AGDE_13936 [Angomonas deanei]
MDNGASSLINPPSQTMSANNSNMYSMSTRGRNSAAPRSISYHHWGVYLHPSVFRFQCSGRQLFHNLHKNGALESVIINQKQQEVLTTPGVKSKHAVEEEIPAVVLLQGLLPRCDAEGKTYNHNYSSPSPTKENKDEKVNRTHKNNMQVILEELYYSAKNGENATSPNPKRCISYDNNPPQLVSFDYEVCAGRQPRFTEEESRHLKKRSTTIAQMSSSRLNGFEEVLPQTSLTPLHPNNFFVPIAESEQQTLQPLLFPREEDGPQDGVKTNVYRQAAAALQNHLYASRVNAQYPLHFYEADSSSDARSKLIRGSVRDQIILGGEGSSLYNSAFLSGLVVALNSLAVNEESSFTIAAPQAYAYTYANSLLNSEGNLSTSGKAMDFQSITQHILRCGSEEVIHITITLTKRVPLTSAIGPSPYLKEAVYFPVLRHTDPSSDKGATPSNNNNMNTNASKTNECHLDESPYYYFLGANTLNYPTVATFTAQGEPEGQNKFLLEKKIEQHLIGEDSFSKRGREFYFSVLRAIHVTLRILIGGYAALPLFNNEDSLQLSQNQDNGRNVASFHDFTFDEALRYYTLHNKDYDPRQFFNLTPHTNLSDRNNAFVKKSSRGVSGSCAFITTNPGTVFRVLHKLYYYRLREPTVINIELGAYNNAHALSHVSGSYTLLNKNNSPNTNNPNNNITIGSLQIPLFLGLILKSIDFETVIQRKLHNTQINQPSSNYTNTFPLCISHVYFQGENMNSDVLGCEKESMGLLLFGVRKNVTNNLAVVDTLLAAHHEELHKQEKTTAEAGKGKADSAGAQKAPGTPSSTSLGENKNNTRAANLQHITDLFFSPSKEEKTYHYFSSYAAARCRRTETHLKLQVNDFDRRLFYNNKKLMASVRDQEEQHSKLNSGNPMNTTGINHNPKNYPFFFSDPRSCLSTVRTFLAEICILLEFLQQEKAIFYSQNSNRANSSHNEPHSTDVFAEPFERHFPNYCKRIEKGRHLRSYVLLGTPLDENTSGSNTSEGGGREHISYESVFQSVNQSFRCNSSADLKNRILFNIIGKCFNVLLLLTFNVDENEARPTSYKHGYDYYFPSPNRTASQNANSHQNNNNRSSTEVNNMVNTSGPCTENVSFVSMRDVSRGTSQSQSSAMHPINTDPPIQPDHARLESEATPSCSPSSHYSSEHYDEFKKFRYNYMFEVYHYISFCFYGLEGFQSLSADFIHAALAYHPKEISLYMLKILILVKQHTRAGDTVGREEEELFLSADNTKSVPDQDSPTVQGEKGAIQECFDIIDLLLVEEREFAVQGDLELNHQANTNHVSHMQVWEEKKRSVESLRQVCRHVFEFRGEIHKQKTYISDLLDAEHNGYLKGTLQLV